MHNTPPRDTTPPRESRDHKKDKMYDKTPPRDHKKEKMYADIITMLAETNHLIEEVKVNKKYCYRLDSKIVGIHHTMMGFKGDEESVHSATYNRLIRLLLDIQEFLKMSSVKHKTILGTFNKSKIQSTFDSLNQRLLDIVIEEPRLMPCDDTATIQTTVVGGDQFSHNSRKKRTKAPLNLLSINSSMSHDTYDYEDTSGVVSTTNRGRSGSGGVNTPVSPVGGDFNLSRHCQKAEGTDENNSSSSTSSSLFFSLRSHLPSDERSLIASSASASASFGETTSTNSSSSRHVPAEQPVWSTEKVLLMMKQADEQREESLAIETFDNLCLLFEQKPVAVEEEDDTVSVITTKTSQTKHTTSAPTAMSREKELFDTYLEHQIILGEGGGCALLVSTFSALQWSVQVSESALRAICYLTRFSPLRSSSNAENIRVLGELGICAHIVTVMNTYARNKILLFWACKAFCNLTTDCLANNIKFGEAGVCRIVISLLKSFGGGPNTSSGDVDNATTSSATVPLSNSDDFDFAFDFSQQIWTCVMNLLLCQENVEVMYSSGACEAILSVWKISLTLHNSTGITSNRNISFARQITLWASMATQNLALNDKHKKQLGILKPSVFKLVVGALSRYIEDMEIAIQGFMVVQNLANNNDKNNASLGDAGACEAVVRVLNHHINEEILAQRGCMAMMNLSYNNERNRIILAKHGACEAIKKVLEIHLDREAVVEFAFGTIVNFTEDRNDLVLHKLSAAGVCEAIMPAFMMHCVDSNCESVAELGGWTIKNLAMANHENNTILGAMGACEGVTSALQGHMGHASVAEMCLWAMRALAGSSENVTNSYRLGACGACEAVTSALQLHYALEAVVEQGCGAVLNLAQHSSQNRALLTAADAYNVIIKAVKEHIAGSNEDIEFIGFGALSNLMRSEDTTSSDFKVYVSDKGVTEKQSNTEGVSEALKALWVAVERSSESAACSAIHLVISSLQEGGDGRHQAPLGKGRACEMLVHLVYPLLESKAVVCAALECICRLSRYGEKKVTANEENIATLGMCGMCKVLVVGMERHFDSDCYDDNDGAENNILLTVWGCKALTYLASNMANNHKLGTAGGCDLITQVLYKYVKKQSDLILKHGWGAVINLTLWEENNLRFGDAGICECLYDYMLAWQDNVDMVIVLLIAAQNLALTALNRSRLGRAGVCKLIMTAVTRYKTNEAVIEYGFMAIQKLALDEQNCLVMYEMKVCSVLVKTIRTFMVNESITELGSMAIMNISAGGNPDIVQALETAGVADCIASMLQKFVSQAEIVEYNLIAINNLSGCSENPKLYGQAGVADSIALIIKQYRLNEVILEQVCKTIHTLLRNKENLTALQQSSVPTTLSKTLVTMSRQDNKLRTMLERCKQMIKTGILTPLTSSGNKLLKKVPNKPASPKSTHQNGSISSNNNNNSIPNRQEPLRLERSSSSSVCSSQSYSTLGSSHPTNISRDGSMSTAFVTKNARTHTQHHTKTVKEVLNKIKQGIANIEEATTATCLRNIARMCEGDQVTQAEFGANGACKEVLESLSTFLNSRSVAENGLRAVCYLSRYGQDKSTANEKNNRTFGQIKLPHMLVKIMQFHEDSDKVSLYGCKAIMNLGSCEENNDMLGDAGACEVVVTVLTKFSAIEIVLKQGLWAMINLALDKKNNARFTSSGCAMVVKILRDYTEEPDIAAWACMAVQNLCINKENQLQLGSMEAVEMVVKTMEANLKDTMTIQFGLMAIEKLVQSIENSRRAGACDACELVLRSLQMFHNNAMIIELCWKSMNRLCNQSLDNCYRFVDDNVCVLLTSCLKTFNQTEEIVEQVLAAIGYLGGTPVKPSASGSAGVQYVRTILGNSGACEAVTLILTTYTSDEAIKRASQQQSDNIGIIFLCLQAIASLSINEEDNRSRFGACGACEKTIAAMTLHLGSEDIAIRGATVVLALGKNHPSNAMKFTATGALTVMLRIIQKNSSNMNVIVMGFSAMTTVLTASSCEKEGASNSSATERATVTFGANTKDDSAQESVSLSVASGRPSMRRDRRTGAVGIWEDAGSYDVILKTIRMHVTNKEISGCGCQLLHSMIYVCAASLLTTTMSGSVGNGRGVNLPPKTISSIGDIIVKLLTSYNASSTRVVSYSCQTITDMLADPRTAPKHCVLLGKLGLCETLLVSLNHYLEQPKHLPLLEKILLALASLCCDSANRVLCGREGLCEKMVTLVYAQMASESVVLCACRVLAALAGEATNQAALVKCETGTLAMVVLEKHRLVGSTVAQVCLIVGSLVQHATTLAQLEALEVHALLVTVLESHLHHASVTQEACKALFHLSQQSEKCCQRLLAGGAPDLLLKVLVSHSMYYRPQTSIYACQTLERLCHVDVTISFNLHKGVSVAGGTGGSVNGRNTASIAANTSIGFVLYGILKGLDDYSPRNCHSSSTNRDLHEKVPFSSMLKRKQNVELVSAVLALLHRLAVQHAPIISDLFPGKHEVASWAAVTTTSLKQIQQNNNHPLQQHDLFKVLVCNIMKQFLNESTMVVLVLQLINLCLQCCPEEKRCFSLQEKFDLTNCEDLWFPILSDVVKMYLSNRKIFLLSIEVMNMIFNAVVRSIVIHTPQLLTYLEVEGLVCNVIAGLSTYLTDSPVLLELTQLVYHFSRVGQFSIEHVMLTRDLRTHLAAEKLIRVLQVHQHDDEHTSSGTSRNHSMTDAQVQAVQLCINCCESLGSICEESEEMNAMVGSALGFCELTTKLLENSVFKCNNTTDGPLDDRGAYHALLDVTSNTLAHLVTSEANKVIAVENAGIQALASALLAHYKIDSVVNNCCQALTFLVTKDEDGPSPSTGHTTIDHISKKQSAATTTPAIRPVASDIKDACQGIFLALDFHIQAESVVRNACWAISQLATDTARKRHLGAQGGGNLLLKVLSSYPQHLTVLELALGAMINLADHDLGNSMALFNGQVLSQMEVLFQTFSGLQRDQHYVLCELLCILTINITEASNIWSENATIITAVGQTTIMQSVLTILSKVSPPSSNKGSVRIVSTSQYGSSPSSSPEALATTLMIQGCWVLKNLTMQHPINSAILGELDAGALLVPVINSYVQKKDAEVAENACAVLISILTVDMANYAAEVCNDKPCGMNNLLRLTEAGGFDVAIQTLFAFIETNHTPAIHMACCLLYRFVFLSTVGTDIRASQSVSSTASPRDFDRDYHNEDELIQSALDSFATIQHVMEEAFRRHATLSLAVTDRTLRVLRHLYFRTFRACSDQYRVFSTLAGTEGEPGTRISPQQRFKARISRVYALTNVGSSLVAYSTKLPLDMAELRDHHRRLVLSDWQEVSVSLGPLLLQHQTSVPILRQLLNFLTELCDSAAQIEIQSSLSSAGVIENILDVLRHYLKAAEGVHKSGNDSCVVVEECGRCLVSLLEGHAGNQQLFLNVGGTQVLLEWLQYLHADREGTKTSAVLAENEAAVVLTTISRVLLTLLTGSREVAEEEDKELVAGRRKQLLSLGVHLPLLQFCLSRTTSTLPFISQKIFVSRQLTGVPALQSPDRHMNFPLHLDLECEVGSAFAPCFLYPSGTEIEAGRNSGGSIVSGGGEEEDERVDNEGERLGGISTLLACIHSLDVLRLLIAGDEDEVRAPLKNSPENKIAFLAFNSSVVVDDSLQKEGGFPVMLVTKLKELCPAATSAITTGEENGTTCATVLPMNDAYRNHLSETCLLAGRELLAQYLLGYVHQHTSLASLTMTAATSVADEASEGGCESHALSSLLKTTLQLLKHYSTTSPIGAPASVVFISYAVVMVVQIVVTMSVTAPSVPAGKFTYYWEEEEEGGVHCLVPPLSDEGVNRTARREVLLAVVSRDVLFPVIAAALESVSEANKGKSLKGDQKGREATIEAAAVAELKHYLLQG